MKFSEHICSEKNSSYMRNSLTTSVQIETSNCFVEQNKNSFHCFKTWTPYRKVHNGNEIAFIKSKSCSSLWHVPSLFVNLKACYTVALQKQYFIEEVTYYKQSAVIWRTNQHKIPQFLQNAIEILVSYITLQDYSFIVWFSCHSRIKLTFGEKINIICDFILWKLLRLRST